MRRAQWARQIDGELPRPEQMENRRTHQRLGPVQQAPARLPQRHALELIGTQLLQQPAVEQPVTPETCKKPQVGQLRLWRLAPDLIPPAAPLNQLSCPRQREADLRLT